MCLHKNRHWQTHTFLHRLSPHGSTFPRRQNHPQKHRSPCHWGPRTPTHPHTPHWQPYPSESMTSSRAPEQQPCPPDWVPPGHVYNCWTITLDRCGHYWRIFDLNLISGLITNCLSKCLRSGRTSCLVRVSGPFIISLSIVSHRGKCICLICDRCRLAIFQGKLIHLHCVGYPDHFLCRCCLFRHGRLNRQGMWKFILDVCLGFLSEGSSTLKLFYCEFVLAY